ncbi:ATP synthase F1 subunit gamma, partial [bacterium]|nr:ATP synthase F1 subunit gamma [bacterium]
DRGNHLTKLMAQIKEIKGRIKSVGNTKKITKAMEMVSAAKMRKSTAAVLKTRTYANLSWLTVLNIARSKNTEKHPLLTQRDKIENICVILMTANKGLCGSLNTNLVKKSHESTKRDISNPAHAKFILLGKKGSRVHKLGHDIIAEFEKLDSVSGIDEIRPMVKIILDDYLKGKYDKVYVAYTDFVNIVTQIPRYKQIIPIDLKKDEYLGVVGEDTRLKTDKKYIHEKENKYLKADTEKDPLLKNAKFNYIYEPNAEEVLEEMIPRLIEVQLFQALLESNASEHSARMNAMHNATIAADDLIDELTLFYNKARQSSITSEIAEISAGANALQ